MIGFLTKNPIFMKSVAGKKSPENFRQMLKAKALLKNRYGSVHINFGEPLDMNGALSDQGTIRRRPHRKRTKPPLP